MLIQFERTHFLFEHIPRVFPLVFLFTLFVVLAFNVQFCQFSSLLHPFCHVDRTLRGLETNILGSDLGGSIGAGEELLLVGLNLESHSNLNNLTVF